MEIVFVTTSENKKLEVENSLGIPITQITLDIDEIQGEKNKIALDKLEKALYLNKDKIVLIDDTSIELKALNGFPGPYGKDFVRTVGFDCIEKVVSVFGRETTIITIMGLGYFRNGVPVYELFEGRLEGNLVTKEEPIKCQYKALNDRFLPNGCDKVYGEMSFKEKSKIGHRGLACKKLRDFMIANKLI